MAGGGVGVGGPVQQPGGHGPRPHALGRRARRARTAALAAGPARRAARAPRLRAACRQVL